MDAHIEAGIKKLVDRITPVMTAYEALKFTQAALNLAHTAMSIAAEKKQ